MIFHLPIDASILLLTVGILLVYFELNRPGVVLPGAVGLCATLAAIATISMYAPSPLSAVFLLVGAVLLGLSLAPIPGRRSAYAAASSTPLILGLFFLDAHPVHKGVHICVALVCGALLSFSTVYLSSIAVQARVNKRSSSPRPARSQGLD